MILLCGIPSESPLEMVAERLDQLRLGFCVFNQRRFAECEMSFEIADGQVLGQFRIENQLHRLEDLTGVYIRLMDDQVLPELHQQAPDSPVRRYCRSLHDTLIRWCEIAPIRVLNRTAPMGSNASKPYQAQLIRQHGFAIPETLMTNEPEAVLEFLAHHKRVIYKSMSGVRSIVQMLNDSDLERLERIRWCPIQLQAFIEGMNVRVHVVGDQVFATAIRTEAADYRYADRQVGISADLEAYSLPEEWAERCVQLAQALELPFAGIDLKITPDDEVYCFEVNPSPGFSYYEHHTQQPIALAVAQYLAG